MMPSPITGAKQGRSCACYNMFGMGKEKMRYSSLSAAKKKRNNLQLQKFSTAIF